MPSLPGTTLSGKTVVVPSDLRPGNNLLIIGFSKPSRSQIAEWAARLGKTNTGERIGIYRISVLEKVPRLVRGYVIGRIRKSIPEDLHDHYLLVLEQSETWEKTVSYDGSDDAFVLLVDAEHNVVWSAQGPCSPEKLAAIGAMIP